MRVGIPEVLKYLRHERAITQKELAEETGLSLSAIISYENGLREPNSKAMAVLESYFGVSGEYLRGKPGRNRIFTQKSIKEEPDMKEKILAEALQSFANVYETVLARAGGIPKHVYIDDGKGMRPIYEPELSPVPVVDKAVFVGLLEMVLRQADVAVDHVRLTDTDVVTIWFKSGWKRNVNIECDSRIAIIKDVLRALE